ncbi:MAG: hypothetical protein ACJ8GN_06860 [Longimicrobiaceae bacterium]
MFGLEILDVVVGLAFVYLLLSLVCSAINEYVSALLNLRGRALIQGIEQLLDDAKDPHLKSDVLNHRLIRSMYNRSVFGRERKPSYIPARSFAMALLDSIENPSARAAAASSAAAGGSPPRDEPGHEARSIREIMDLLKDDALADVVQTFGEVAEDAADAAPLPRSARRSVTSAIATSRTELQKLHDSVEVWFNNAMDRVSGAYKRRAQMWLFLIGLVVAVLMNADTVGMWRQLSSNQQLRDSLAKTAVDQLPSLTATVRPDSTVVLDPAHAKAVYDSAMAQLDRSQLRFGWSAADAQGIWVGPRAAPALRKLLGLLITAVALSLGAPFWFDLLNKIVNIRATGRAPNERPRAPEAPGKRLAEVPPK